MRAAATAVWGGGTHMLTRGGDRFVQESKANFAGEKFEEFPLELCGYCGCVGACECTVLFCFLSLARGGRVGWGGRGMAAAWDARRWGRGGRPRWWLKSGQAASGGRRGEEGRASELGNGGGAADE